MNTMARDPMMPAVPTIQVRRRKRMTPRMFCRQGRYTPMKVPIWGLWRGVGGWAAEGRREKGEKRGGREGERREGEEVGEEGRRGRGQEGESRERKRTF